MESIEGKEKNWPVNMVCDCQTEMHTFKEVLKHKLCIVFPCVQIPTHLYSMFIRPVKAEQCLHNVIKVVEALRHIGLDYDIQVSEDSLPTSLGSFTNLLVSMSVD